MTSTWARGAAGVAAFMAVIVAMGCGHFRQLVGLEPSAPPPTELPTGIFAGTQRILSLPGQADGRLQRIVTPGSGVNAEVAAGDTAVLLALTGPAVVRRIRIALTSSDPHWLRRVALRMHWDDEIEPSVHVPLGDFFANGFERRVYASLAMGVTSEGFYSYLPMPFARSARIVLENGTSESIEALTFDADVETEVSLTEPVATLHALWSRDPRPRPDRRHRVADIEGAGWFVGTTLTAQGHEGSFAFLRGNGVFRVDGTRLDSSTVASYLGASPDAGAAVAGPLEGVVLQESESARLAAYRWHLADPIPFRRSFRLELERGRANREGAEYATVAYWYQSEPHRLPLLPGPHERRVPEVLVPRNALWGDEVEVVGMGRGVMRLTLPVPRPDRYEVNVFAQASPGSVNPTVSVVGSSGRGRVLDVNPVGSEPGDLLPGTVVDTVAVNGRAVDLHMDAGGGGVAVPAAVQLRPLTSWAARWWRIGSWPSEGGSDAAVGLRYVWGPDNDPALDGVHRLPNGRALAWEPLDADEDGAVALTPRGSISYAQSFLYSPRRRAVTFVVQHQGALQVRVDSTLALERPAQPGSVGVEMDAYLLPGWNRVWVKLAAASLPGRFRMRVADPFGELYWARTPY